MGSCLVPSVGGGVITALAFSCFLLCIPHGCHPAHRVGHARTVVQLLAGGVHNHNQREKVVSVVVQSVPLVLSRRWNKLNLKLMVLMNGGLPTSSLSRRCSSSCLPATLSRTSVHSTLSWSSEQCRPQCCAQATERCRRHGTVCVPTTARPSPRPCGIQSNGRTASSRTSQYSALVHYPTHVVLGEKGCGVICVSLSLSSSRLCMELVSSSVDYAMLKGSEETPCVKSLCSEIRTGSSAARAMPTRKGVGSVKHHKLRKL